MLQWGICEWCARLWTKRGLHLDRAHRVGKLVTRSDCPWLEQRLSAPHPRQIQQHNTRHPRSLVCSVIQENETSQKIQTKSQKTVNKVPSPAPMWTLKHLLAQRYHLAKKKSKRGPLCWEKQTGNLNFILCLPQHKPFFIAGNTELSVTGKLVFLQPSLGRCLPGKASLVIR